MGGRTTTGNGAKNAELLGPKWKVSPYVFIQPGETFVLADIEGQGCIQQIWMTLTGEWRNEILRFYWDNDEKPAVEVPAGDFFCNGMNKFAPVSSLPVCVNPGSAFNCYWDMPFRKHAKITLTNLNDTRMVAYYQINYALGDVPEDAAYFHAQFCRTNPVPFKQDCTILDNISGRGQYVGVYMVWGANGAGWWGEGEMKFFLDDDGEYPTICGTGTEDYFCGSYGFQDRSNGLYKMYSTPYAGLVQHVTPDGPWDPRDFFGLYRWHITDPIRFEKKIRVTVQDLGWDGYGYRHYLPLQDDISSTAFFYLDKPSHGSIPLPEGDALKPFFIP